MPIRKQERVETGILLRREEHEFIGLSEDEKQEEIERRIEQIEERNKQIEELRFLEPTKETKDRIEQLEKEIGQLSLWPSLEPSKEDLEIIHQWWEERGIEFEPLPAKEGMKRIFRLKKSYREEPERDRVNPVEHWVQMAERVAGQILDEKPGDKWLRENARHLKGAIHMYRKAKAEENQTLAEYMLIQACDELFQIGVRPFEPYVLKAKKAKQDRLKGLKSARPPRDLLEARNKKWKTQARDLQKKDPDRSLWDICGEIARDSKKLECVTTRKTPQGKQYVWKEWKDAGHYSQRYVYNCVTKD